MGAAGGLVLAVWLAPSLGAYFPSGPVRVQLNGPVLSFATAITVLATVVFGLAPALRAGRIDALAALRSSGRGTERRRRTLGATEPFLVAQIAVSLVLMFGAVLFARSLFNLEHEPLGFDQDRVLTARINPRLAGYTTSEVGSLYRRLYDSVAVLPGVEAATFARYSPFGGYQSSFGAAVEGYTAPAGARLRLETVQVGPNYPQTLGMPLIEGRASSFNDVAGAPLVAMVNEAFVRRFFPTSSPLGHHIQLSQTYEIVGVVRDALFYDARDQMILSLNARTKLGCAWHWVPDVQTSSGYSAARR
jgi:hypothetical protein